MFPYTIDYMIDKGKGLDFININPNRNSDKLENETIKKSI